MDNKDMIFFRPDAQQKHEVQFENQIFISIVGPISYAWLIGEAHFSFAALTSLFEAVSPFIVKEPGQYECKVIGSFENLKLVLNSLEQIGFKNIKNVSRRGPISLNYCPATGNILLKKDSYSSDASSGEVERIKILIIDDSSAVREMLRKIISQDSSLQLVPSASHPSQAEMLIELHKPHVILLDIHMPGMDGVTLQKKIGPKYNIPTLMITSLNMDDGCKVLDALEQGALDYIQKPGPKEVTAMTPLIIEKIKATAKGNFQALKTLQLTRNTRAEESEFDSQKMILIAAGMGGIEYLRSLLLRLPKNIPPILVVQHFPTVFSKTFAKRMDEICPFKVEEASENHAVKPNTVLIAPGGMQMTLVKVAGQYRVNITDMPAVNKQKPSADVLFRSAAPLLGADAVGVVLTGLGEDGARGLLALKEAGAQTFTQDPETTVIDEMPKNASQLRATTTVCSFDNLCQSLMTAVTDKKSKAA